MKKKTLNFLFAKFGFRLTAKTFANYCKFDLNSEVILDFLSSSN